MQPRSERSPSESYFWPSVWAVAMHALVFAMLFVSFAMTPELPPARPIVQATLYQLQSQSQATTQTNQKIAGEAKQTKAPQYEVEQLEQRKAEQEKQEAIKAAERKKADEARKAEAAKKQAEAKKAEEAKKAAEQKRLAEIAKKKAEEEKKKKLAEEAKKKQAEEAKRKAAELKKAEEAKKRAAAEAARKAADEKKAQALAELLGDTTERQQAMADTQGDQVAGSLDDLIILRVSEQWRQPPSARAGMSVELLIQMLPDGTITNASVTRSSGDAAFDSSAVAAVRNVGRISEMQQLDRVTFDRLYRQRRMIFKPEDLGL
jgi:colicin import membrane protein